MMYKNNDAQINKQVGSSLGSFKERCICRLYDLNNGNIRMPEKHNWTNVWVFYTHNINFNPIYCFCFSFKTVSFKNFYEWLLVLQKNYEQLLCNLIT